LGDRALSLLGPKRAEAARSHIRAFAYDFGASTTWSARKRELQSIQPPVILLAGSRTSAIGLEVTTILADLTGWELAQVDAGHFAQLEQPAAVAEAIRRIASA
jgi:pimeloyl-ACP methyl ester carboxylesterase